MNINRKLIGLALSSSFFSFYNLMIFSLMNDLSVYLVQGLHLQSGSIGFLASWDLWGNVIGFIPIGLLLDYYSIRYVGLSLFAIAILATIAFAYSTSLWMLCFLRFLQGLASASSLLILMRIGTTLFPGHANKTIGFMILIALSGGIAGNLLFSLLAQHYGWQAALLGIAAIGVMLWLFMLANLYMEESRCTQIKLKILLSRHSLLAGIHIGLLSTPIFLLGSLFGNQYLMQHYQLNLNQASAISSLIFMGIIIGAPIVGLIAEKVDSIRIILTGYLLLFTLTIILSLNIVLPYSVLSFLFLGLGIASCTQNLIYPIIYYHHPEARSTATGAASVVSNGIGALMQIVVGFLLQYSFIAGKPLFLFMLSLYLLGIVVCRQLNK